MKYSDIKGAKISAFSLGTVQLGYNYGINNSTGKPTKESAFAILDEAIRCGVNCFDTSDDYGDSERIIGEWIAERKTVPDYLTTKLSSANLDHSSLEALRKSVREGVARRKETLHVDCIPVLMLHDYADYAADRENMKLVFRELKEAGDIRFCGISAYSNDDYEDIAASGFDAVQIPLNIFDQRKIRDGGIQSLADHGMMIFIRSVYLQGLVFKNPENLDERMSFCREPLERFGVLCREFDMNSAQMCMSFLLSVPGTTGLVLGCERPEQVTENAALVNGTKAFTREEMARISAEFENIDERVINPRMWFNNHGN